VVADSASVWDGTVVRSGAVVGERTIIGRHAYVGPGVMIGNDCKIQNQAQLYETAVLEDGVFVGPAVVFTNDRFPRAVTPDGRLKSAEDWDVVGVTVRRGASIGAGAVCVAPVEVGEWAMVAAGAVVTADVPAHGLVAGLPARRVGWVGRSGQRLRTDGEDLVDPETGDCFREIDSVLVDVVRR
jgi:UDP-2-acetamido-3-amino-2,3-dideoxy-glucuronate N-acetyltransferase